MSLRFDHAEGRYIYESMSDGQPFVSLALSVADGSWGSRKRNDIPNVAHTRQILD
jgi:hypothetical protein